MSARALIERLREAAKHVKKAAEWNGSGFEVDGADDHYVYELLCYLTLCGETAQHFKIKLVTRFDPKLKKNTANWPRSPGLKANHSYLTLHDATGQCQFELCPGINVADRYGKDRAADINLLVPSVSPRPTYKDLRGIWDAKHRIEETRRINGMDVSDFVFTYGSLNSPTPPDSWTSVISLAFQISGLLTNGQFSTEPDALLAELGVQETAGFPEKPQTRPTQTKLPVVKPAA